MVTFDLTFTVFYQTIPSMVALASKPRYGVLRFAKKNTQRTESEYNAPEFRGVI